ISALAEHPLALILALATTLLTPYYMGRAFLLAFAGAPRGEAARHPHEPGWSMLGPMLVLAAGAVLAGLALPAFGRSLGLEGELHVGPLAVLAIVLSLGGLLAAWVLHGPRRATVDALPPALLAAARSGAVDRLYELVWRRVVYVAAVVVAFVDRYLVDGVMNLVAWTTLSIGSRLRRVQSGLAP